MTTALLTSTDHPTSTVHVGVLSPHPLVVHGVAALVASYDAAIAVHDLGHGDRGPHAPHVTLVDSALVATGAAHARSTGSGVPSLVLVRPEHAEDAAVRWGCPAGMRLPLAADGPTVVNTIRRAARAAGHHPAHGGVPSGWDAGPTTAGVLSPRELEVLRGIARGRSNDEIAADLYLSVNTVKTYVRTAYRKIGVTRRAEAVAWTIAHDGGPGAPGGAA